MIDHPIRDDRANILWLVNAVETVEGF